MALTPYYDDGNGIQIFLGDCREILPYLEPVDLVLTDPPYLTGDSRVPIRGRGVGVRREESISVGMPWEYSLDWLSLTSPAAHWVVFANYKMLGGLCSLLDPSCVFTWRKNNAARMTRPVPRLDCEFIVWARGKSTCERMGEFQSMVIDEPMLQAGCFASERILEDGSLKAAHPCQKPIAVVAPFIERLNAQTILDPFMGSGTTLVAARDLGRRAIGVEIERKYCDIAIERLRQRALPLSVEERPAHAEQEGLYGTSAKSPGCHETNP